MEIHGWISMDIHGYPWISMDIHGWISMGIDGYPWMPMDTNGYAWMSIDIHGYPRIGQMIPTGFGYGYNQSGIPSYSQPKEGGDSGDDSKKITLDGRHCTGASVVTQKCHAPQGAQSPRNAPRGAQGSRRRSKGTLLAPQEGWENIELIKNMKADSRRSEFPSNVLF